MTTRCRPPSSSRQPHERPRPQPLHRGVGRVGASVPRPRAVLVVSAHWYTTTPRSRPCPDPDHPRLLRVPEELFAVDYRRRAPRMWPGRWPGREADLGRPGPRRLGAGPRHLVRARARLPRWRRPGAPAVDQRQKSFDDHVDLGARLAPLRSGGVLILGSGNVVHNLRRVDWSQPEAAFDWSLRFDEAARAVMRRHRGDVGRLADHADFGLAVPTPTTSSVLTVAGWPPRPASGDAGRRVRDGVVVDDRLHGRCRGIGAPAISKGRLRSPMCPRTRPTCDPRVVLRRPSAGADGGMRWPGSTRDRRFVIYGQLGRNRT